MKKKSNKILAILISLTMVLSMIPMSTAFAVETFSDDGWETCGTCVWQVGTEGTLVIKPANGASSGELSDWGNENAPWYTVADSIKRIEIEGTVIAKTCSGMFEDLTSLTDANLDGLDTSQVTKMDSMFSGCSTLVNLNVTSLDTSSATDMSIMFSNCSSITNLDLSSFNTENTTNMLGMFLRCDSLTSLDLSSFNTTEVYNMELMFFGCNSLTSLDLSSFTTSRIHNMQWMFAFCNSLTSLDISSFNTSNVYSMQWMFLGCSSLTNLDISSFNTSNVTDMWGMFMDCSSLTSLDLSGFDTSNVENMSGMLSGCSGLTSLDLSKFNTSNVTDMSRMFAYCNSLTSLDLSGFDTSNVENMSGMFSGCSGLTSLDLSKFNTTNVTDMSQMFSECNSLKILDLSKFNTSNVTDMSRMFEFCNSLTSLDLSNFDTCSVDSIYVDGPYQHYGMDNFLLGTSVETIKISPSFTNAKYSDDILPGVSGKTEFWQAASDGSMYASTEDMWNANSNRTSGVETYSIIRDWISCGTCVWKIDDEGKLVIRPLDGKEGTLENWSDFPPWVISGEIKTVEIQGKVKPQTCKNMFRCGYSLIDVDVQGLDTSNVTDMSGMFSLCYNLTSLDLSGFDTSNVEDMSYMFSGCSSLTSVSLRSFDTSEVKNMRDMFSGCERFKSLDLSKFNTTNATDMSYMFLACDNLKSLDLSSFDTTNVTNMRGMFADCSSITNLDLSSFDTTNVIDMRVMFADCSSITNLDLSSFNTSKVMDMGYMFEGCSSLVNLDLSKFDTTNVRYMDFMFNGCSSLTSVSLSSFVTPSLTDMRRMFYGCGKLTSLDLSSFDTSKVTNMEGMFFGCSGLTSLDISSFDTSEVKDMSGMFSGCERLTSLDLSSFKTEAIEQIVIYEEESDVVWKSYYGTDDLLSGSGVKEIILSPGFCNCNYSNSAFPAIAEGDYWKAVSSNETYTSSQAMWNANKKRSSGSETYVIVTPETAKTSIDNKSIEGVEASYTFTGNPIEPKVIVSGLTEGEDFFVKYSNNVELGTATITVSGTGKYIGTIYKTFNIIKNQEVTPPAGGGGGGGAMPPPVEETDENIKTENGTVTVDGLGGIITGDTAQKIIEASKDSSVSEVVVNGDTLIIGSSDLDKITDNADVVIKGSTGDIRIDSDAYDEIAGNIPAGGSGNLEIKITETEGKYDVSVSVDGEKVDVPLEATVKIPKALKGSSVVAVQGNTILEGKDNGDGTFTVKASEFEILSAEDADLRLDAYVKDLVKGISMKCTADRTARKKITVKASFRNTASKNAAAELKKMGYTYKYRFYRSAYKTKGYAGRATRILPKYINTSRKMNKRYYYKVKLMVYDPDGKYLTSTTLTKSTYSSRVFR